MNNAKASIEREKTTRMEILRNCRSDSCVNDCDMEWYECARQVLQLNSIKPLCVCWCYEGRGRGKLQNVLIVAAANCGKKFLLKLLEIIFQAFTNPANGKYAWAGADQAEMVVLHDFRWSSELICWKD